MTNEPVILDEKAEEAVQAARNAAQAVEESRIAQFQELTESLKERTTATITLAENKAKSLVESAAKDALNLLSIARREASDMVPTSSSSSDIKVMANDIGYIKKSVAKIEDSLGKDYVTRAEFNPIQKGFYGLGAFIILAFVGALTVIVFKS